ncbi:MAG: hypothetical protein OXC40_02125 [Proteobacteria bacterium]|nr:hypothetical protein [Pseudomonadota bacterium]
MIGYSWLAVSKMGHMVGKCHNNAIIHSNMVLSMINEWPLVKGPLRHYSVSSIYHITSAKNNRDELIP